MTELSLREIEVLRSAASGRTNVEIGRELGISQTTVRSHLQNVMSKLHADNRTQAVYIGVQTGIIGYQKHQVVIAELAKRVRHLRHEVEKLEKQVCSMIE